MGHRAFGSVFYPGEMAPERLQLCVFRETDRGFEGTMEDDCERVDASGWTRAMQDYPKNASPVM